jgi:hypothetical protein
VTGKELGAECTAGTTTASIISGLLNFRPINTARRDPVSTEKTSSAPTTSPKNPLSRRHHRVGPFLSFRELFFAIISHRTILAITPRIHLDKKQWPAARESPREARARAARRQESMAPRSSRATLHAPACRYVALLRCIFFFVFASPEFALAPNPGAREGALPATRFSSENHHPHR